MNFAKTLRAARCTISVTLVCTAAFAGLLGAAQLCQAQSLPLQFRTLSQGTSSFFTWACSPPGRDDMMFVCERYGEVYVADLSNWTLPPAPVLTLPLILNGGEQGLLGMACHPQFDENGFLYFFANTTTQEVFPFEWGTAIVRYTCPPPERSRPDPSSRTLVYFDPTSRGYHVGGWIDFGPDGLLYCAVGDASFAWNAQTLTNFHGKVLRLDVDRDDFPEDPRRNYAIPPSNPFAAGGGLGEIFLWGLRNPFRCGFDRDRRLLYVADVGGGAREELSVVPIDGPGRNLGWPCFEGTLPLHYSGGSCGPADQLVFPIIEYRPPDPPPLFETGFVIIGGGAYTGCAIPELRHKALLTDF